VQSAVNGACRSGPGGLNALFVDVVVEFLALGRLVLVEVTGVDLAPRPGRRDSRSMTHDTANLQDSGRIGGSRPHGGTILRDFIRD
jgi:hypothetical protein